MKISILVQSNPISGSTQPLALQFAREALSQGHALHRIFFYKDAVHIANRFSSKPADETELQAGWTRLARDSGTELVVCIAAGQRRGVVDGKIAEGFSIVGLGQMVEAMFESDRTVTF